MGLKSANGEKCCVPDAKLLHPDGLPKLDLQHVAGLDAQSCLVVVALKGGSYAAG